MQSYQKPPKKQTNQDANMDLVSDLHIQETKQNMIRNNYSFASSIKRKGLASIKNSSSEYGQLNKSAEDRKEISIEKELIGMEHLEALIKREKEKRLLGLPSASSSQTQPIEQRFQGSKSTQ